jgi:hypothetical protein
MNPDRSCSAGSIANDFYPRPALFSDVQCLGTAIIAAGCADDGTVQGRIPAHPGTIYQPQSLLRHDPNAQVIIRGLNAGTNWFQRNGWRELIYYAVDATCTTSMPFPCVSGTVAMPTPAVASRSNKFVLVSAGRPIGAQQRSTNGDKTTETNYLEGENATPLDNTFAAWRPVGIPYNDITFGIPCIRIPDMPGNPCIP